MNHIPHCFCLAALILCLPTVSYADALGVFGAGARGSAMGGAQAAVSDDYTALYYNVANLAFQDNNAGASFMLSLDDVSIRLKDRPDGYDLPNLGSSSPSIPSEYRLNARQSTQDIPNTYGVQLGAVGSLGFKSLRIGVLAYLPLNGFSTQQTRYPDEREQYFSNRLDFALLGRRTQRQVLMAGLAWRFGPKISMGAGVSFAAGGETTNQVLVNNPTDQSQIELTLNNDIKGRLAPLLGLSVQPTSKIHVGLAWRGEQYFGLSGSNLIQIRGFQGTDSFPVRQEFEIATQYTPGQGVFGTSYQDQGYLLAVDVTYMRWSEYLNQQAQRNTGFEDTLSIRLGIETDWSDVTQLRGGLALIPSPVPDQTGRTNYVDNDRVAASLGAGYSLSETVEVSWFAQVQWLRPRDTNKSPATVFEPCALGGSQVCDEVPDDTVDPGTGLPLPEAQGLQTGNPGFPGFDSYGTLLTMGLDVIWRL